MSTFRTLFRTVIMVSVLVIVAKGWLIYGPSSEQVASLAVRAVELGDSLLGRFRQQVPTPVDPRSGPAPFVAAPAQPAPLAESLPATAIAPPAAGEVVLASAAEPSAPTPPLVADTDAQLEMALAQLQQLGTEQHQLQPWGTRGQLYRFCCSAAWNGTPGYSRHFEAVAGEPLSAVQQVVDQVAAWRAAEQDATKFR